MRGCCLLLATRCTLRGSRGSANHQAPDAVIRIASAGVWRVDCGWIRGIQPTAQQPRWGRASMLHRRGGLNAFDSVKRRSVSSFGRSSRATTPVQRPYRIRKKHSRPCHTRARRRRTSPLLRVRSAMVLGREHLTIPSEDFDSEFTDALRRHGSGCWRHDA